MKKLKTKKELDDIIHSMNSDSLCVVKIGASWCGPCKQLERVIHNVETSNDQYLFYDIDIDDCLKFLPNPFLSFHYITHYLFAFFHSLC